MRRALITSPLLLASSFIGCDAAGPPTADTGCRGSGAVLLDRSATPVDQRAALLSEAASHHAPSLEEQRLAAFVWSFLAVSESNGFSEPAALRFMADEVMPRLHALAARYPSLEQVRHRLAHEEARRARQAARRA